MGVIIYVTKSKYMIKFRLPSIDEILRHMSVYAVWYLNDTKRYCRITKKSDRNPTCMTRVKCSTLLISCLCNKRKIFLILVFCIVFFF